MKCYQAALPQEPLFRRAKTTLFRPLIALLIVAGPVLSPQLAAAQERATLVAVDEVIIEPLRQSQPIQGRFVARQSGPVAARTRGTVMELQAAVGDRVEKGDPIASLDTERLAAEVERRRAEIEHRIAQVEGAKARFEQASQGLERLRKLRQSAAFSRARYDDQVSEVIAAKSEIAEFQAMLRTARADLALAEIDLAHSTIRAPFSGVVVQRHTQAGAYLREGDRVVDLVDDRSLEIEADVPASRIQTLAAGMLVPVTLDGKAGLQATVRAVVPQENTLSRTRAVRFSPQFNPSEFGGAAEAAVTVRVPVGEPRDVLTVHKDAVIQQGGTIVYAVEDGKAARKRVILGESTGSRFVVLEGLKAGMKVVIRGNERLRPGQPVRYEGQPPPAASSGTGAGAGAKKDADS